jgi:protein-disulfide isomerase
MERDSKTRSRLLLGITVAWCLLSMPVRASAQSENPVMAIVNGRQVMQREVDDSIVGQILNLEEQIYALRKVALENLILRTLLEETAKQRGILVDELKRELTTGHVTIKASDIDREYSQNVAAFGAMSPDEAKERIRLSLEDQERMKLYGDRLAELRKQANIEIRLDQPRVDLIAEILEAPTVGPKTAPVVIIEFSDFQCPFCKQAERVIKKLLEAHPQSLRFVFKHLPLAIHEQASDSARAAFCAAEQDLFWRYHDALFASTDLSPETLREIAAGLGMNRAKFKMCQSSEASEAAILKDVAQARRLGIEGTPTFIINGRLVRGLIPLDEFEIIVAKELARAGRAATPQKP